MIKNGAIRWCNWSFWRHCHILRPKPHQSLVTPVLKFYLDLENRRFQVTRKGVHRRLPKAHLVESDPPWSSPWRKLGRKRFKAKHVSNSTPSKNGTHSFWKPKGKGCFCHSVSEIESTLFTSNWNELGKCVFTQESYELVVNRSSVVADRGDLLLELRPKWGECAYIR